MSPFDSEQRITIESALNTWLTDCKARRLSPGTVYFYRDKLRPFKEFCKTEEIEQVELITPDVLRRFFLKIAETHNSGGQHAHHRAIGTFLRWYEVEYEPEGWKNPIKKVKAPEVQQELLDPISLDDIRRLIKTCNSGPLGKRDKAIFYTLIDTGLRANELLNLNVSDFDMETGQIAVRNSKSKKPRAVFTGLDTRRAIRKYLRTRTDSNVALFINRDGARLKYYGLRMMLDRRVKKAGVSEAMSLHSFRRGFALEMVREKTDTLTLQRLMGHADPRTTGLYTKFLDDDLRQAHEMASPGDKL